MSTKRSGIWNSPRLGKSTLNRPFIYRIIEFLKSLAVLRTREPYSPDRRENFWVLAEWCAGHRKNVSIDRDTLKRLETLTDPVVPWGYAASPRLPIDHGNIRTSTRAISLPSSTPTTRRGRERKIPTSKWHHPSQNLCWQRFRWGNTLQEAQEAVRQLDQLCMADGFNLQKWTA